MSFHFEESIMENGILILLGTCLVAKYLRKVLSTLFFVIVLSSSALAYEPARNEALKSLPENLQVYFEEQGFDVLSSSVVEFLSTTIKSITKQLSLTLLTTKGE